jgi:SAM-dependent methyltransferase
MFPSKETTGRFMTKSILCPGARMGIFQHPAKMGDFTLLRCLYEKILLFRTTNFRGDYRAWRKVDMSCDDLMDLLSFPKRGTKVTVYDSGWEGSIPRDRTGYKVLGGEAIEKLLNDFEFQSLLDIGCGAGEHTSLFLTAGKDVTTIDAEHYHTFVPDISGNYETFSFNEQFDAIWASHVLEHVLNVHMFLRKIFCDLKDDGVLAITVPPLKHNIVEGHLSLFNTGLLLYRLVSAGFDCSKAIARAYGYNISVIVRKKAIPLPPGQWSFEKLKPKSSGGASLKLSSAETEG